MLIPITPQCFIVSLSSNKLLYLSILESLPINWYAKFTQGQASDG
ncbi:hypothetical protein CEDIAZO_01521 [Celerinatantimonas diazotrophica]|nr:hypothetical protein CEDIAZO_01521 [Celerinatantimonas diazotrophica]